MREILSRPGTRFFLAVLLLYSVCPPFTSNDSYWVVPTALCILHHGNTAVDEYVASAPETARYAVECVSGPCPPGHWYNYYPVGVAVLSLPVVALIEIAVGALRALYPGSAGLSSRPIVAALLSGDLVGGHALVELAAGALFGALAAWLMFRICARFLERARGGVAGAALRLELLNGPWPAVTFSSMALRCSHWPPRCTSLCWQRSGRSALPGRLFRSPSRL